MSTPHTVVVILEAKKGKEEHQGQFNKPYIKDLGEKLEDLLAKPYQVLFIQQIIANA